MAPLPYVSLPALRGWLGIPPREYDSSLCDCRKPAREREDAILSPVEGSESDDPAPTAQAFEHFSPLGLARWCCLHVLSSLSPDGPERARDVFVRVRPLPLDQLDLDDRYRFLAWLLVRTDLTDSAFAETLALWLVGLGLVDDDRLRDWSGPITDQIGPEVSVRRPGLLEFVHVLRQEVRRAKQEPQEQKPRAGSRSPS
jgi:hypothetical protein